MTERSKYKIEKISTFGKLTATDGIQVDGGTVLIKTATNSTSITTGAVQIYGGMGLKKQLNVGDDFTVDGHSQLDRTTIDTTDGNFVVLGTQSTNIEGAAINIGTVSNIPITIGHSNSTTVVLGNFTVKGTSTIVESDTVRVKDKNMEIAYPITGSASDTSANGGGITLKGTTDKTIIWNDSTHTTQPDAWAISENFDIPASKYLRTEQIKAISSDISIIGNALPNATNTYDLGNTSKSWNNLYIGSGSLYLNGIETSQLLKSGSDSYTLNNLGIGTNTPIVSLHIEDTDSVKLPKGTTAQRPAASAAEHKGYIRYNTTTEQFEGFGAGNQWGSLGGVMDVDQDTYVKAESTAGTDNDELWFNTAGFSRMRILNDGKIGVATNTPVVSLEINTTDSVKLPKGTTAQRPTATTATHKGYIRYNTTTDQFEGFGAGNQWGSLGGVMDVDQDTYIKAESTAGADNDQLIFVTANNERMRISSAGNVSVGIDEDAVSKFEIYGNLSIGTDSDYTGALSTAAPTNGLSVEGNVGIGLYNASKKLHVSGDGIAIQGTTTFAASTTYSLLGLDNTAGNFTILSTNGYKLLDKDTNELLRLTSAGKMGLGTTTPQSKLDVEGNVAIGATYSGTTAAPANGLLVEGTMGLGTTTPQSKLDVEGSVAIGATYSGTTAAPANGLLVEGIIGLGKSNPTKKLHISGDGLAMEGETTFSSSTTQMTMGLDHSTSGNFTILSTNGYRFLNSSGNEVVRVTSAGRMSVGETSSVPGVNTVFSSTDAVQIPVGTTAERPGTAANTTLAKGQIRFNTTTKRYEGYSQRGTSNTWVNLEEVMDSTGNNYITTLDTDGTDLEEIQFYTGSGTTGLSMNINSSRDVGIGYGALDTLGGRLNVKAPANKDNLVLEYDDNNFAAFRTLSTGTIKLSTTSNGSGANDGDILLMPTGSKSVGIGTTTPSEKLQIDGYVLATGIKFPDGSSQTTSATGSSGGQSYGNWNSTTVGSYAKFYPPADTTRVSIGHSTPDGQLSVKSTTLDQLELVYSDTRYAKFKTDSNGLTKISTIGSSGVADLILYPDGNVGIGTTTTSAMLTVAKDIFIPTNTLGTSTTGTGLYFNYLGASDYSLIHSGSNSSSTQKPLVIKASKISLVDVADGVGIGTSNPDSNRKLHVAGNVRIEGDLLINGSYNQILTDTNNTEQWRVTNDGTGPAAIIKQNGTQPVAQFIDINVNSLVNSAGTATTSGSSTTLTLSSQTDFDNIQLESQIVINSTTVYVYAKSSSTPPYNITIDTALNISSATSFTYRLPYNALYIKDGGNIGIGTTTPASKLDVEGNMSIGATYSGTTAAPANGLLVEGSIGVGQTTTDSKVNITSTSAAAEPVLHLNQENSATPILKITGTSVTSDATKSLVVNNAAVTAATIQGYVRCQVVDSNGSGITDGAYYIPLYTLT